jgi:hypothetical protein
MQEFKNNFRNCMIELLRYCHRHDNDCYKRYEIRCSCLENEQHKTYKIRIKIGFEDDSDSICGCSCECRGCENCRCPDCSETPDYTSCTCVSGN